MCVAITGKVLEVGEKTAKVDIGGTAVNARTGLVSVAVGDNVLVHAGCILQKVSNEDMELMTLL